MTDTERASAERFAKWLEAAGERVRWEPVENDPPDFLFEVSGERWAVEATELHHYFEHDDEEMSQPGATRSIEEMCERIREEAAPTPNKSYAITAFGPLDSGTRNKVVSKAVEYINAGRTQREWLDLDPIECEDADLARVLKMEAEAHARVSIVGIESTVSIGYSVGTRGDARIPGAKIEDASSEEALREGQPIAANLKLSLSYSLDRILKAKGPKLKNLANFDLKVLLIWKGYQLAQPLLTAQLLAEKNLDGIDAIFFFPPEGGLWIVADPSGRFLSSGFPAWPWAGKEP